ncbi:DrmB family protein [Nonomuraea sp. NPDC001684]
MALRDGRSRRAGGRKGEAETSRKPLGGVRRAQMITTYGVGAMVALEDQSYIVSGLDTWKIRQSGAIYEPRLQRWLDVSRFQLPPADNPSSGDGVRIRLFPDIYSCPGCQILQEFKRFGSPAGKSICGACQKSLVPSRFVIACENGHLDNFPYFAWVHKKTEFSEREVDHTLTLHSTGRTAALRSVVIKCSCGKSASLEGALSRGAMDALGIKCTGRRPWLWYGSKQTGCTAVPRGMQRGSSAAWFPINRSALSIPPWSETLQQRLNPYYKDLAGLVKRGASDELILGSIEDKGMLRDTRFTAEEVLEAVHRRMELEASARPDSDEEAGFEPMSQLRREEYDKLYDGTVNVDRGDDFECVPPKKDAAAPLPDGVERSMLVKRLREVRVLQSFTRVEAPDPTSIDIRRSALSMEGVDWLPAIEVSGEGVFLAIDQHRLQEWETRPGPVQRSEHIRRNHLGVLRRRAQAAGDPRLLSDIRSPVRPRYLLLHTLAHVLINEWTLEAGYPAAALRERLYVSNDMAGVLIYTATSDSAGSLGGVVAQGEHRQLRASLESALARASWCSQDPPCMEAEARGVDSLNLAACYACVLLAEVSCETNNVFLDRALLVGTPDDPATGFFSRTDRLR